jgi:hypothetical protein
VQKLRGYRFDTFTLILFVLLLPAAMAHAQPTEWQSRQEGSVTRYSGTDANGGHWTGSSYEQWGTRFYEFTRPDGHTRRCRAYELSGARQTECWP